MKTPILTIGTNEEVLVKNLISTIQKQINKAIKNGGKRPVRFVKILTTDITKPGDQYLEVGVFYLKHWKGSKEWNS